MKAGLEEVLDRMLMGSLLDVEVFVAPGLRACLQMVF